jgi:DNA-binding transcriptional regulator YhcF (GntR family)
LGDAGLGNNEKKNLNNMAKVLRPTDRLLVPFGTTRKLAKDCGVHESTVTEALRGMRNTPIQQLIRERAVKFYNAKW